MKREILCLKCKIQIVKNYPKDIPPNEKVKFVAGNAMDDFKCDNCYKQIFADDPCWCMSMWVEPKIPYIPWESEFIYVTEFEEDEEDMGN